MRLAVAVSAVVASGLAAQVAAAGSAPGDGARGDGALGDSSTDGSHRGAVLPEAWSVGGPTHWVVGVALERSSQTLDVDDDVREILLGVSTELRRRWVGPHLRLLVDTHSSRYNERRLFADLGFRAYLPLLGTEASFGVGGHFDARLHRHYWLVGVTPLEVGVTAYGRGSWRIGVFAGARVALGGQLLDSFLLDPNGLNNEAASRDLLDARDSNPWEGFLTIVFGRRVD